MKCICVVTGVDIWGSNRYMISDGQNNGLNDSNVMYMYREQKPSLEKKILCNDPCRAFEVNQDLYLHYCYPTFISCSCSLTSRLSLCSFTCVIFL